MQLPRPFRRAFVPLLSCAVAALAAACSSSSPVANYDLSAPRRAVGGAPIGQLVVAEPGTVQPLETERIIVKDATGAVSFIGGGQWTDRLPRLVQARLIQTFENSSRIRAVSRPGERIVADYQLNTEIRAFQIDAASGQAVVEMSARLVNDRSGRIAGARVFTGRVPVAAINAANAAQALDQALSIVLLDIVRWTGTGRSPDASAT